VRFHVDRRLIDMNQDRKNQRDQTQPRYTQVGPQLFHTPYSSGITLKIYCQVKSGYCDALFVNAITRPGSLLLKWSARLYYLRKLYMGIHTFSMF